VEVILLDNVSKLGELGAKVRVKPGFGRNYLIPQGKALPATKKNLEVFEVRRAELEKIARERLEKANERVLVLEGLSLTITAHAGEEGRLFGSVGPHEIVQAVKNLGHDILKSEVRLKDGPIRQVGEHEISLCLLGDDVTAKVRVVIVAG